MYAPYPVKVESILDVFSDAEQIKLLKAIATERNNRDNIYTPLFLMNKLNLSRRDLDRRMEKLITLGVVDMINGIYSITQFGKDIHEALIIVEDAIKLDSRFSSVDRTKFANDIGNEFFGRVTERFY